MKKGEIYRQEREDTGGEEGNKSCGKHCTDGKEAGGHGVTSFLIDDFILPPVNRYCNGTAFGFSLISLGGCHWFQRKESAGGSQKNKDATILSH